MLMTVLRQGRQTSQLDHLTCIEEAADTQAVQMILFSQAHNKPVLVGLDTGEAILKPLEAGDDALTFERLYDSCITISEFKRMTDAKVTTRENLPLSTYEMRLIVDINAVPTFHLKLLAKDDADVRRRLLALINDDTEFREELVSRFCGTIFQSDFNRMLTKGAQKIDDGAPEGTPPWKFID